MTIDQPTSSSAGLGRMTNLVLGLIVFVCLALIGFTGFFKYQLDRSESYVSAPSAALEKDFDAVEKLRRAYGYSGFVGIAQNFAASHDINLLPDMRSQMKTADDIMSRLPEKVTAEQRHDIGAIVATFATAMQKAEKSVNDGGASFTELDMEPLYAALPILDSRFEAALAERRLMAQNEAAFWSMMLTLLTWVSLILAATMAAGIYLTLLSRQSAPMKALAQSVRNLARGDIRTSVWGMERQDIIGELARAIDTARYHFSQLPDMSLMSDKGPVRLRFEGNTRSLFEAMMNVIGKDSENVRQQASSLSEAISKQHEVMTLLTSRVEAVLHNIENRGMDGDKQVRDVLSHMINSADMLKGAQEHAADQLNRIIPYLQERANGMAEITNIAGKQIAQTLQSLTSSERSLKSSSEQSHDAITKLTSTADELSGRLFGAVNLLQASGKVLAETTESTQSRLNEVIAQIGNDIKVSYAAPAAPAAPSIDPQYLPRIEDAVLGLEAARKTLEERLIDQTSAAKAQIELMTTHSTGLLTQTATMTQTLSTASDNLRNKQSMFDEIVELVVKRLDQISLGLEDHATISMGKTANYAEKSLQAIVSKTEAHLAEENAKLEAVASKVTSRFDEIATRLERQTDETMSRTSTLTEQTLTNLATKTEQHITREHEKLTIVADQTLSTLTTKTDAHIRAEKELFEKTISQIASNFTTMSESLTKQAQEALSKTDMVAENSLRELANLSQQISKTEEHKFDGLADQISIQLNNLGDRVEAEAKTTFAKASAITEEGLKHITLLTTNLVRDEQAKFTEVISQVAGHLHDISSNIEHEADEATKKTKSFTEQNLTQLATLTAQHLRSEQSKFDGVIQHIIERLDDIGTRLDQSSNDALGITNAVTKQSLQDLAEATSRFVREEQNKFDNVIDQVASRLSAISNQVEKQGDETFGRTSKVAEQSLHHLNTLSNQLAQVSEKMTTLDRTTTNIVAATSLEPAFVGKLQFEIRESLKTTEQTVGTLKTQLDTWAQSSKFITPEFMDRMRDHWYQMAAQIEASRSNLSKMVADEIARLEAKFEKSGAPPNGHWEPADAPNVMEQQTAILSELVVTMGLLDSHVQDIEKKLASPSNQRIA